MKMYKAICSLHCRVLYMLVCGSQMECNQQVMLCSMHPEAQSSIDLFGEQSLHHDVHIRSDLT